MTFHVGQKVVCVDDEPRFSSASANTLPVKGSVYTVRWVGVFKHPKFGFEELCVHLREINRSVNLRSGLVIPYLADRFRPIVSRQTDISIFRALLNPSKVDA